MSLDKKVAISPHGQRTKTPNCMGSAVWGFFLSFLVVKHPPGYSLSLSFPSNHLHMIWQTTPAVTETKKVAITSTKTPPPCCRVSVDNNNSISHYVLKWKISCVSFYYFKYFLSQITKIVFFYLTFYYIIHMSDKKSPLNNP